MLFVLVVPADRRHIPHIPRFGGAARAKMTVLRRHIRAIRQDLAWVMHEAVRWVIGNQADVGENHEVRDIDRRTMRTSAASRSRGRPGEPLAYPLDTSRLERAVTRSDRPLDGPVHA